MKKRIAALALAFTLSTQSAICAFADTDDYIFTDTPQNVYSGRSQAYDIIRNINFTDIPEDHYARQSIMQNGALDFIKGYSGTYNPDGIVSKQEALAFLLRVIGRENDALNLAPTLQAAAPENSSLRSLWSIGYLNIARQLGLITNADYNNALLEDQATLEEPNFRRSAPVTRQELAKWIFDTMRIAKPTVFTTTNTPQALYRFSDWETISPNNITAVEAIITNNIMEGIDGRFRPNSTITRAEMSVILKNLDSIYFNTMGITVASGTVGAIRDNQQNLGSDANVWRNYLIRNSAGHIDAIRLPYEISSSPQRQYLDVPVYKNGQIGGLTSLAEGDQIEYFIRSSTSEVLFINVTNRSVASEVTGRLYEVDPIAQTINIQDSSGRHFIYHLADGLLKIDEDIAEKLAKGEELKEEDAGKIYLRADLSDRNITMLPYGSRYRLSLVGSVVTKIEYVGEPTLINEVRGIVLENNAQFSYLTILNNDGRELTYEYFSNDMVVEKQQHYDLTDEVGYFDEMFPYYKYDPRDTVISDIEAGDIVFVRANPNNPNQIASISAATNYTMKYGKIMSFTFDGDIAQVLVEYENKQTAWFDVPAGIHLSRDGRPISMADIQVGDWTKLLVNQAILQPGYIIESVKEMTIEGDEHFISTIVKGQLAGINAVQNQLLIQNAQVLTKMGWTNHKQLDQFSLAGKDIEFYNGSQRISLDYALQYLRRANGEVYIALENNFTGEKVRKVTFRPDRDTVLAPDTIVSSNGSGAFMILSNASVIETDEGTIVRRHGRLVSGKDIIVPDYATVILNGQNRAAVVDISEAPDNSGMSIVRGRIQSVDQGNSFTVQSMALLTGVDWVYTPVQRQFTIDYNTLFLNQTGFVDSATFLDYGDTSVLDRVYTIIVDGSKATRVIESPYANQAVRGTIYNVADDGTISIRDAHYYNRTTGAWLRVSSENNVITINTTPTTIISKNSNFITTNALQEGEQIRMMINELPETIEAAMTVTGHIGFIEN